MLPVNNDEKEGIPCRTLILGIGNEILTDDGIGPKIVNDLKKCHFPEHVTFATSSLGGLEILELISGYDEVVLIDAIRTRGGKPGDVYLMDCDDFKETLHLSSFHDVSFLTGIPLGRYLDLALPSEIRIIAIEIVEDLVFSANLSPILEEKYPQIYTEIVTFLELKQLLQTCT